MSFLENSAWFKVLSDGEVEYGTDGDIVLRKASWTKGRQDIVAVSYIFDGFLQGFTVICPPDSNGEFTKVNQLDEMVSCLSDGAINRIKRTFKVKNNNYKNLYKFENYFLNNNIVDSKEESPVRTEMLCYQLTAGENEVGQKVLEPEEVENSSYINFSINSDCEFSIKLS